MAAMVSFLKNTFYKSTLWSYNGYPPVILKKRVPIKEIEAKNKPHRFKLWYISKSLGNSNNNVLYLTNIYFIIGCWEFEATNSFYARKVESLWKYNVDSKTPKSDWKPPSKALKCINHPSSSTHLGSLVLHEELSQWMKPLWGIWIRIDLKKIFDVEQHI